MVRVGIEFPFFDNSWLGGISAISNLINALKSVDQPRIEPILIAGWRTPDTLLKGMDIQVRRTNLIDAGHWSSWPGRVLRRTIGRNALLESWLKRNKIDVYSHCSPLGRQAGIPTIGHIADFGYKYFSHLYPNNVFATKDEGTARICNEYDVLLLSSCSAQEDYRRFFPDASARSAVLNIVPTDLPDQASSLDQLVEKFRIPPRYIHSPNQFWVHKNHGAIIEALSIARQRGHDLHVVCTGRTHDERKPEHFDALIDRARALGVDDLLHVLGVIAYQDVMDLMRHSRAVLSASLFEGWGISITEAKLLGKAIVLSDIPVFREQDPERARYFDPRDPEALATQLIAADSDYCEKEDWEAGQRQRKRWPRLVRDYALGFEEIVMAAAAIDKF